jgi:uncharacterized integral membrane protein
MSFVKIIAILLIAIALGIVVVSNFSPAIPIVLFGSQTLALPMGVWLLLAIAGGFLLGSLLQVLFYLQRRPLTKRLRQLQQQLGYEEDVFTYRSPRSSDNNNPTSRQQVVDVDVDDWETEPLPRDIGNWEDTVTPPRAATNTRSRSSKYTEDRYDDDDYSPPRQREENESSNTVYDADFKLIQPPYKEPPDSTADDYPEPEEFDREYDFPRTEAEAAPPREPNSYNREDEDDWGFDFEHEEEFERPNSNQRQPRDR